MMPVPSPAYVLRKAWHAIAHRAVLVAFLTFCVALALIHPRLAMAMMDGFVKGHEK